MQIIENYSQDITQIFEIINVVYDPTDLSFDPIDTIITNFNKALSLASNIDSVAIKKELYEEISTSDDIVTAINTTLYEFAEVLNWKSDIIEIPEIKDSQKKDLIQYFEKLSHLNIAFTIARKQELTQIFINIGLRLLKARNDLQKIIDELERLQEISQEMDEMKKGRASEYNLMLEPEKINEFIYVLLKLYENNFFQPVNPEVPLSEADVLLAFENFLENDMIGTEWYNAEIFDQYKNIMPPTNKKASLPGFEGSPEELKRDLYAFFRNINYDGFLDLLSDEFKSERGKTIAILLYVLEKNDPPLISIPHGKMRKFYTLLKAYFNTNIGTYQSIVNFSVSKTIHKDEINAIQNRIDNITILL